MNFFDHIQKYVTDIEKSRGLTTTYQLSELPRETLNDKISLVIALKEVINGMKGREIYSKINQKQKIDDQKIKQYFANAQGFRNSQNIVFDSYIKILTILVQDINMYIPAKPNYDYLEKAIKEKTGEYADFIKTKLDDNTKNKVQERIDNDDITGHYDIDFQVKNISIIDMNDEEIIITDAKDFSKIKQDELKNQIKKELDEWKLEKETKLIFENLDVLVGASRRPTMQLILKSILFNQPYTKYAWLVKNYNIITEYLEKNKGE